MVAVDGDRPGSGYAIAGRLVLTSAHVSPEPGGTVRVFRPGREETWCGTVVWRGTPGGRDDAALVSMDPAWAGPRQPVRWGRTVTHRPGTPCETWGAANLVQRPGRAVDTVQLSGTLNPGDRFVGNRYVMSLAQHPPAPTGEGDSPWGGMSGAALFCGDLLAGVIASDPAGRAHAHLEAVPAYVLTHDPGFHAALTDHAPEANATLEPVEWQHLAEPAARTRLMNSPATLLQARRQIVPFRGRTTLLTDLDTWAQEDGFGAKLLHGPGGQGKTRLAQHLADTLTTRGWTALWLRADAPADTLADLSAAAVPLLVIVDYAETRSPQLTALLEAAAQHVGDSAFKVLLLARTAGDWWNDLHAATATAEDLLDGTKTIPLPALEPEPDDSRTQAYHQAVHSYAAHLPHVRGWQHHDWPTLAAPLTTGTPDGLNRPGLDTALTLHMTALADLLDTTTTTAATADAPTVEDRLLVHERRYWTTTATAHHLHPRLTTATLTDALAAAHLLGADTHDQADTLLRHVPALADQTTDRIHAVRRWIAALYPAPTPAQPWGTLQPDRLTEHFTGRHLLHNPTLAHHLAPTATEPQAARLLTLYSRAAAHPALCQLGPHLTTLCTDHAPTLAAPALDVATQTETPQPLIDALNHITDNPTTPPAHLQYLAERLPHTSYNLAPYAAHLTQHLTEHHRTHAHRDPTHLPDFASSLNDLSNRLGDLGRWEEALKAIEEAVEIRRGLARDRPDAFRPELAMSLNNLAVRLGKLGRWEEALKAIEEAVQVYRGLARDRPDAFRPELAMSLNNLAVRLGKLGRQEEALKAIEEAVQVYRGLARDRPDAFRPELAMSLNNLAVRLGKLGRQEEALKAIEEAVQVYRGLARDRPDAFRPELAMSLNNLAVRLGDLGRQEEALKAIEEAVEIRRGLARDRPDAFRPDLASSSNNLAVQLGKLGRQEEALKAIEEAVQVYRGLARDRPDAFRPDLAMSLNNLAVRLGKLGRQEEALKAIEEAVQVYRGLARDRPDAFRPDLAMSSNNLAVRLGKLGRQEEALKAIEEAVEIRRGLARDRPDAFRPDLASSLNNLAVRLAELDRREEALKAIEEAVEIRRKLARDRPKIHQSELEHSLKVLDWLEESTG
ncbi:tetratricopeptide repeat protein [Streptomyces violaceusniger]|uniref:Tetratricopeptide TPR_2 repeat-containing protein n=1 Tax=Streptomyces violaceusniger (strain Tu 4113) TaxID=653045 RepID=G2PH21_STRV4|nr:tetratricopeptide repeat protein [Streptomyces violaceusniger]AEM88595.1 Tetratricopeptide TPR_2 repeat-containing protein [Streptomyces violaceusniger Tu 4113]